MKNYALFHNRDIVNIAGNLPESKARKKFRIFSTSKLAFEIVQVERIGSL
jgi:hypothetical protein